MDDDLKPLDFIKDFQEYLTQQTHHVNMISGSVGGEIDPDHLQAGETVMNTIRVVHFKLGCIFFNKAKIGHIPHFSVGS